jgi:hypothetical protein
VATNHRWGEVHEGFGFFDVGVKQCFDILAAVFFCKYVRFCWRLISHPQLTLFIHVPDLFKVYFGTKASPDHTQTSTPRDRIRDCIIFVQVMLREACIYTFIREDRIRDFGLLTSCAYSCCNALLDCPSFPLYAQNFWPSRNADSFLITGRALREMY